MPSNDRYKDIEDHFSEDKCRKTKQRIDEWYKARDNAVVTGSTFYNAIGQDGLKKMQQHFDSTVCNERKDEPTDEVKSAMKYGTDNESVQYLKFILGFLIGIICSASQPCLL